MKDNLFNKPFLYKYLGKVLFIWLIFTIVVTHYSNQMLIPFLHYFSIIGEYFIHGFSMEFSTGEKNNESTIILNITTTSPVLSVSGEQIVPAGKSNSVSGSSLNMFVPVIILFSLALAWSMKSFKCFVVSLFSAITLGILILLVTVPFQAFGIYQNQLSAHAIKNNQQFEESIVSYWQTFCDAGGVWLLAVIAALISIYLGERQIADLNKKQN